MSNQSLKFDFKMLKWAGLWVEKKITYKNRLCGETVSNNWLFDSKA